MDIICKRVEILEHLNQLLCVNVSIQIALLKLYIENHLTYI